MSERQKKPECPACGADDYDGELSVCPNCEGLKCSFCDMGNDVGCAACAADDAGAKDAKLARDELRNIAEARRFDRDYFCDDTEFADWAQSRARFALSTDMSKPTVSPP